MLCLGPVQAVLEPRGFRPTDVVVDIAPNQRERHERPCRYVSRPPVATERMALTVSGQVRYGLKTPYRDGTTHIVLESLACWRGWRRCYHRRACTWARYYGVLAPHGKLRAAVTPARRAMGAAKQSPADPAKPPAPRHVAMSWARRLKRVFGEEIEGCARCGGELRITASIEEPEVIAKILSHLQRTAPREIGPPALRRGRSSSMSQHYNTACLPTPSISNRPTPR